MRKDAPGSASGFTLVELSVTLVIVAVLAGLALPGLQDLLERQRVDTAMFLLSSQLAQARSTAITQRTPVTVCPSQGDGQCLRVPDWSSGWLVYRDPLRRDQPGSPGDILQDVRKPFHHSIRILASTGRLRVRYYPEGFSGGNNVTLRVCASASLRGEIIVSNAGRARGQRPTGNPPCPIP
ncbi:MAG: Tfp pilus assembly protein FimT/FimU [Pseudoxanthomonas sp.]|nr:Tfp pilus assembly protein FimT/FimU [Pseudoxanthomonas sp.]